MVPLAREYTRVVDALKVTKKCLLYEAIPAWFQEALSGLGQRATLRSSTTTSQPATAPHTGGRQAILNTNGTVLREEALTRKLGISTSLSGRRAVLVQAQEDPPHLGASGNRRDLHPLNSGKQTDSESYQNPSICAASGGERQALIPENDTKMYRSALLARRMPSGVQQNSSLLGHVNSPSRPEDASPCAPATTAPDLKTAPRLLLRSMSDQLRSPKAQQASTDRLSNDAFHQHSGHIETTQHTLVRPRGGGDSGGDSLIRGEPSSETSQGRAMGKSLSYTEARVPYPPSQLVARAQALAADSGSRRNPGGNIGGAVNPQTSTTTSLQLARSQIPPSSALITRSAALNNECLQKTAHVANKPENARTHVFGSRAALETDDQGPSLAPPKGTHLRRFLSHQGRSLGSPSALTARALVLDAGQAPSAGEGPAGPGRPVHNDTVGCGGGPADVRSLSKSLSHQPRSPSPQSALTLRAAALAAEKGGGRKARMPDNSGNALTARGADAHPDMRMDEGAAIAVPMGRGAAARSLSHELRSHSPPSTFAVPAAIARSALQLRRATDGHGAVRREEPYVGTGKGAEPAQMSSRGSSSDLASSGKLAHPAVPINPGAVPTNPEAVPIYPEAVPIYPEAGPINPEAAPINPEAEPINPEAVPTNPMPMGPPQSPARPAEKSACGCTTNHQSAGPVHRSHEPSSRDSGDLRCADSLLPICETPLERRTPDCASSPTSAPVGRGNASDEASNTTGITGFSFGTTPASARRK